MKIIKIGGKHYTTGYIHILKAVKPVVEGQISSNGDRLGTYSMAEAMFFNRGGEFDWCFPKHIYVTTNEVLSNGDWCTDGIDVCQIDWITEDSYKLKELDEIKPISFIKGLGKIVATTDRTLKMSVDEGKECAAFHFDDYQYANQCGWCGGDWSKCLKSLPNISNEFLKQLITEYNKGNVIIECLVGVDCSNNDYFHKKVCRTEEQGFSVCYNKYVTDDNENIVILIKDNYTKE